ncbi:Hypothetical protein DEACI_2160 [Acididesulfobacillus acetoxydans]|uniref:Uncharacterized protein n=1 Tax=Acididesulfobacillus acetoxydans TaxID=1561005 RepID=A0A8S0VX24_9FIRM|nr:hypothetical protein [Acididesulfobacillus acetoxydans]CAA7601493.1 Hypothetical protein DEACI_2160 [Acididesulfobacillus acetoxydans]CEJ06148.1 Hypothetical protein DEACI_0594 [Acididesulfobacillus acetoxydans]
MFELEGEEQQQRQKKNVSLKEEENMTEHDDDVICDNFVAWLSGKKARNVWQGNRNNFQ